MMLELLALGWGSGTLSPPDAFQLHFFSQPVKVCIDSAPVETASALAEPFRLASAFGRCSGLRASAFRLSAWSFRLRESEFRLLTGGLDESLVGGELGSWLPLVNLPSPFFVGASSSLPETKEWLSRPLERKKNIGKKEKYAKDKVSIPTQEVII